MVSLLWIFTLIYWIAINNRNMSAPKKKGASELDTGSSNNAGSSSRLKPSKRRYVNNKSKNGKKGSSHK